MDTHTLKVLEYDSIIAMLRERTACALGDDLARHLTPTNVLLHITEAQRETSEALRVINEEGALPLGGIHDIRDTVNKAAMDAMLQPVELLDIAGTLASGRRLRAFILKRAEEFPKLSEFARNIGEFKRIEEAVSQAISDHGEVRDTASPELAKIRSKLKTIHARMIDRLHSIIHSSEYRTMIQEPVVTKRGDRYCIPVKAEYRSQLQGIVHDVSSSGATLFIEPVSAVEMGNDLRELAVKEQKEVERILKQLTGFVHSSEKTIRVTLDALARLDFSSAKGQLSADMHASEPELNVKGHINLRKARHPLLTGEVVPIVVELGKTFRALLITGPNTGGKTVSLKTIGLLTLMAQSGLHIPSECGSEIAVCDHVFADIGDEQSIQQSLSTFSSHMNNIVHIIKGLGQSSLVLLDEIGAGTDPEEGAAIAKSVLDHLIEKGALTAATTHYGELKEFAFIREGIENASVEFDVATLQPTYRLMVGVPGSSNAFAIASRLGLPEEIVQDARDMVKTGEVSEEMIRRIEESHRSAAEREQSAERISRDVEILRRRYEERLSEIEALKRDMRKKLAEEVDRRVRDKINELDEVIRELKKSGAHPGRINESRQLFKKQVEEIEQAVEDILPAGFEIPEGPYDLKKGDRVRVMSYGIEGDLLNDPIEGEALVMAGSIKIMVPVSDVRPVRRIAGKKPSSETASSAAQLSSAKATSVSPEIMLRGQRAESALEKLDKYLDDAYLAGLTSVRVIHGKGTGVLRKVVWEHLKSHHAVESYRLADANEGGSGATIVEFKKG